MTIPIAPWAVGMGAGTPSNPWVAVTSPATGKTYYVPPGSVSDYYAQYNQPAPAPVSSPTPTVNQEAANLWVTNPELAAQQYEQGLPAALEPYPITMPPPSPTPAHTPSPTLTTQQVSYAPPQTLPDGTVISPSWYPDPSAIPPGIQTVPVSGIGVYPQGQTPALTPQGTWQPIPTSPILAPPITMPTPPSLEAYMVGDNQYNLLAIAEAGKDNPELLAVAKTTFPTADWIYLEYAAKLPLDVKIWEDLTPTQQQFYRPMMDISITEYNQLLAQADQGDSFAKMKLLTVSGISPLKVSLAEYKGLGEGGKKYVTPQPSGWAEKLAYFPTYVSNELAKQAERAKVFYSTAPLPPGIKQVTETGVAIVTTAGIGLITMPLLPAMAIQNPSGTLGGMKDFIVNAAKGTAKGDPWAIGEMLVIAAPIALPMAKGIVAGVRHGGMTVSTLIGGGTLPSALKTGRISSIDITLPKIFDRMVTEAEAVTKDQSVYNAIFKSGLTEAQQIAEVGKRLNPQTKVVYDWYMKVIDEASDYRVPKEMIRDVNLAEVESIPQVSANALKQTLWTTYKNDIEIHGSFADWLQTKGIKGAKPAADIDINISTKSSLTVPELQKTLLDDITNTYGANNVRIKGAAIEVYLEGKWTKALDIHKEGTFGEMAYQWKPKEPMEIDGVKIQSLNEQIYRRGEQIVNPGVGGARGLMGPKAAGRAWRVKDYQRFDVAVTAIAEGQRILGQQLNLQHYIDRANRLEWQLDALHGLPRGKPLPIEWGEGQFWQGEFVGMIGELQKAGLKGAGKVTGDVGWYSEANPFLIKTGAGVLDVRLSPSAKVMPNVLYTATPNIKLWVDSFLQKQAEALKTGKPVENYVEVGGKMYNATIGQWIDAPSKVLFASQEAAFNYLFDLTNGKIPKEAGVIAIKIAESDIGSIINPAFRVTYDVAKKGILKKEFVAEPKVLDEMTVQAGSKLFGTAPNEFSQRSGITRGEIGETWTYEPRTQTRIPVVWLATESAKRAGYGAPTIAQIRTLNRMALWNAVTNILEPHLPKKMTVKWESARKIPSEGFVQFFQEKWRWQGKEGEALKQFIKEEGQKYSDEIRNTIKREDYTSDVAYEKAITDKIATDMAKDYGKALEESGVKKYLETAKDLEKLDETYVIELNKIAKDLGLSLMSTTQKPEITELTKKTEISPKLEVAEKPSVDDYLFPTEKERQEWDLRETEPSLGKIEPIEEPAEKEKVDIFPEEPIEEIPPEEEPPFEKTPIEETPIIETMLETTPKTEITKETIEIIPPYKEKPPKTESQLEGLPYEGALTWKQGRIKRGRELVDNWHLIMNYDTPGKDVYYDSYQGNIPPPGARVVDARQARASLQVLRGDLPSKLTVDMGIQDILISKEGMKFTPDIGQTSQADVTVAKSRKTAREKKAKKERKAEAGFLAW